LLSPEEKAGPKLMWYQSDKEKPALAFRCRLFEEKKADSGLVELQNERMNVVLH